MRRPLLRVAYQHTGSTSDTSKQSLRLREATELAMEVDGRSRRGVLRNVFPLPFEAQLLLLRLLEINSGVDSNAAESGSSVEGSRVSFLTRLRSPHVIKFEYGGHWPCVECSAKSIMYCSRCYGTSRCCWTFTRAGSDPLPSIVDACFCDLGKWPLNLEKFGSCSRE